MELPSGQRARVDDPAAAELLGAVVGETVALCEEEESGVAHFDTAGLHLLSTSSVSWLRTLRPDDQVEIPRFRPNVVVEVPAAGRPEEGWIGRTLEVGEVTATVGKGTGRCVMVTMNQPRLRFAPGILGELERRTEGQFGVYGTILEGGRIRVGDEVLFVG